MSKLQASKREQYVDRLHQLRDLCSSLALAVQAEFIPDQILEICELAAEELQDIGQKLDSQGTRNL